MFPPGWFVVLDVILQFVTALIATAVAIFAFRGYKWSGERTLFCLFLSFSLLATAFFINALTFTYAIALKLTFAEARAPFFIADVGLWAYYILEVTAYMILAYSYARRLRGAVAGAVLGGSLFFFGPLAEMIIVVLLFVTTLAQFSYYSAKRSTNSLIVSVSFSLLLIANVLMLFGMFTSVGYVAGKLIQMVAFLSLLVLLNRLRGTE